jgi:hypothetical protein
MSTKIRPFNLHTSVDSHVKGLIDSDYIQARQTAGTDSAATQGMIDSAIGFQVDSAYIALRQDAADSASINTIITTTTITGKIAADLRTNPKNLSRSHTIDSNSNGLLVGPFNVDSGVTITVNGTLMVV